jgi:ATP-dependent protease Clp ATPase subunit
LNQEGNALVKEYKNLVERLIDPNLTEEGRAAVQVAVAAKMEAIKAKQRAVKTIVENFRAGGMLPPPSGQTLEFRRAAPPENSPIPSAP